MLSILGLELHLMILTKEVGSEPRYEQIVTGTEPPHGPSSRHGERRGCRLSGLGVQGLGARGRPRGRSRTVHRSGASRSSLSGSRRRGAVPTPTADLRAP